MPSKFSTARKAAILGMPIGTATARLRKQIMFDLVRRCGLSVCHRCGIDILSCNELSIEHKEGWQLSTNPVEAFFDIEKIGFSHLLCNIKAGARPSKKHANRADAKRAQGKAPEAVVKKAFRNAARDRRKAVAER